MSFNVDRLADVPALAADVVKLTASEVSATFDWIGSTFSTPYGQIDWSKVPGATSLAISRESKPKIIRKLLALGFPLDARFHAVWSDAEDGVSVRAGLAFEHYDDLWYPSKEDLWLVLEDRSGVIEFHHEEKLGAVRF